MTIEERIKNTIGDLVMQLHAALAKIECLENELKEKNKTQDDEKA